MFRIFGLISGLTGIGTLVYGALLSMSKPQLDNVDLLLVGVAFSVVSSLMIAIADKQNPNGQDSSKQPTLPKS